MKRIVFSLKSFLLGILLVISNLAIGQAVNDEFISGKLKYKIIKLDPAKVEVTKKGEELKGDIIIPEKVTYKDKDYLVTSIGDFAFSHCSHSHNLTSITIPHSVVNIGNLAFDMCEALTSITIPNSVISIGQEIFISCKSLTTIIVEKDNPNYMSENGILFNKDRTTLIKYPSSKPEEEYIMPDIVENIEKGSFSGCVFLKTITLSNSIKSISERAFSHCKALTTVNISNSVTSIEQSAFYGCEALGTLNIPNTVISIKSFVFGACRTLTSITIPNSVTSIGNRVFINCPSLTSINVSNDNTKYSSENGVLFNKNKTILIKYPIGKKDEKYIIPNSVTNIGKDAFYGCVIPYYGTSRYLKHITIPNSVINIGSNAFNNCISLLSINSQIENVNKVNLGKSVFHKIDKEKCKLYVPKGTVEDYKKANQWKDFKYIINENETGINENQIKDFVIYPTLVENGFTLQLQKVEKYNALDIYSITGQKIRKIKLTTKKQYVDVSDLKSGVYIAKVNDEIIKFIKR